jgi:hypothetical protein
MDTWARAEQLLKDEALDQLADEFNVAQFVSYGPDADLSLRFCRVIGLAVPAARATPELGVEALLSRSSTGTVNIRTFRPTVRKGNPFRYGLDNARDVLKFAQQYAAEGFYVIVNETITVDDGGVSGVRTGGITEFAPGGTPRIVEEADVLSVDDHMGDAVLDRVYRVRLPLPRDPSLRVEFSIHPRAVGYRRQPWIVWEVERFAGESFKAHLRWPNRFSQHIGDKAFGLLVADVAGLPVPRCVVLARGVPPFEFGRPLTPVDRWIRTCPRSFSPGKYPTIHGWTDPFSLMAEVDPSGDQLASVLVQDGVDAEWSGAARIANGEPTVEGVVGQGDQFMLGVQEPVALPPDVTKQVVDLLDRAAEHFGPVRAEWVANGDGVWLVQLNQIHQRATAVIAPGTATEWRKYDPDSGLEVLRSLIAEARRDGSGVEVTRPVGLTSHVGDLLRDSNVPARFSADA